MSLSLSLLLSLSESLTITFVPVPSPQALLTLFVFSTKDGWVTIMYDGIDAVGVDKQVGDTFIDFEEQLKKSYKAVSQSCACSREK